MVVTSGCLGDAPTPLGAAGFAGADAGLDGSALFASGGAPFVGGSGGAPAVGQGGAGIGVSGARAPGGTSSGNGGMTQSGGMGVLGNGGAPGLDAGNDATMGTSANGGSSGSGGSAGSGGVPGNGGSGGITGAGGTVPVGCKTTELMCGATCVPNDTQHCGTCTHDCTNLSNVSGAVTCSAGACTVPASSCKAGFAHCTGGADSGCETNIATKTDCGACGKSCPANTPVCAGSGSTYACVSGCPAATPTLCSGTTCVDTTKDALNCGTCGKACTTTVTHATAVCSASACGFQCTASYPNTCSGACVDFQTDAANCGKCGNACTGGQQCIGGACQCTGSTHPCSGTCVAATDTTACGASCVQCTAPSGGSVSCNGTSCVPACPGGTSLCNGVCVNTQTDKGNCGACGRSCAPGSCSAGSCTKWSIAGATSVSDPRPIASDGTYVAWGDLGSQQCNLVAIAGAAGGLTPTAFGNRTSPGTPTGVAVSGLTAVCVESSSSAEVWTMAENGSPQNAPTATVTANSPSGLAVNAIATQAFFQSIGTIYQCGLGFDGMCTSIGTYPATFPPFGYRDVALGNGLLYAAEGLVGGVGQFTPNGSTTSTIASGQGTVEAVATDATYVYWTSAGSSGTFSISRAPQSNPSAATVVAAGIGGEGIPLVTDGTNVYFQVFAGGTYSVASVPVGGGTITPIAGVTPTADVIEDLALAKGMLFWTQVPTPSGTGGTVWGLHL
jgi:hypothetical protein